VDSNGEFSSDSKLDDGKYLVEALVPGYKATSIRIDLKGSKKVDLILMRTKRPKAASVDANVDVEMGRGSGGATLTPPQL